MKLITPFPQDAGTEYLTARINGQVYKDEAVYVRYIKDLADLEAYAAFVNEKTDGLSFTFYPSKLNPGYYELEY